MAPPRRPWFRLYVEVVHDRKIRTRPPAERWLWITLMAMARSSCEPGTLLIAEGVPADEAVIADEAALPAKDVLAGLAYFEKLGMIERNDLGAWVLTTFLERQYESDSSTNRTAKHRSNDVASNVDETATERSPSVSVSLSSDDRKAAAAALAARFAEFYDAFPLHKSRHYAETAFRKAIGRVDFDTLMAALERYKAEIAHTGTLPCYPATWLNQDRWLDEPAPAASSGRRPDSPPPGPRTRTPLEQALSALAALRRAGADPDEIAEAEQRVRDLGGQP